MLTLSLNFRESDTKNSGDYSKQSKDNSEEYSKEYNERNVEKYGCVTAVEEY